MFSVGVEEEIFDEFFRKLQEYEEIPKNVLDDLKSRYENGKDIDTKNNIIRSIRLGDPDEDK